MKKDNRIDVLIDKNAIVDNGEGVVRFNGGLTLSDESEQMNGTRYDMASMDISRFDGRVFADHNYSIQAIVGEAFGVAKQAGRLVAEGVRFAVKESGLARFAYDMVKGGFINAVSIGTFGELTEEGVYTNSVLKEFSFVGLGNNENATISSIAQNAIQHAEEEGLDTKDLRNFLQENNVKLEEKKPTTNQGENMTLEELRLKKNDGTLTDEETKELAAKESQAEKDAAEAKDEKEAQNKLIAETVKNGIEAAVKPFQAKIEELEKNAKDSFNKNVEEPKFELATSSGHTVNVNSGLESMDWKEATQLQIQSYYKMVKQGDQNAQRVLSKINNFHIDGLKKAGLAKNTLTIADFGNFVTNPELITEIQGYRSDFSEFLAAFPYQQTNSQVMAWLVRSGDINMQPVEMCDDGEDGNLKPISEYSANYKTKSLEELAAVTPVCNAATIFLAADLLGDVAQGYRHSYDANKARGLVSAFELAAELNPSASYGYTAAGIDTAAEQLEQIRLSIFAISQGDGVLVMNEATYGIIWSLLATLGLGSALIELVTGGLTQRTLWGKRFVIVPNELLPTIGDTGTYKTFSYEGANVVINHAIYYINPNNVRGRENGGLRYDLSTEAAYEDGGTVKSAFQRNEIVLRGSHFRGTAVLDTSRIGAVRAGNVIS